MSKTKPKLAVVDVEPIGKDVVEKIGEVLGAASAGEIAAVAIAVTYRNGATGHSWSEQHNYSLMLGGIERMKAQLARVADDE